MFYLLRGLTVGILISIVVVCAYSNRAEAAEIISIKKACNIMTVEKECVLICGMAGYVGGYTMIKLHDGKCKDN